jgi:ribosomal protein S18 acetylase RimI-like enzyme
MTTLHVRHGYAALLAASAGSPFVRYEIPEELAETWWEAGVGRAVAFRRIRHHPEHGALPAVVLMGDDAGVAALAEQLPALAAAVLAEEPVDTLSVTLPEHLEALVHKDFRVIRGGEWEWFYTTELPPPVPGLDTVVPLDDVARREEVATFLERHSPTADTAPAGGERWFAVETSDGRLAAVTAYGRTAKGVPHLSSVAVDDALRGQGLGRRIVAAVTRLAVLEHGVCTLGMYSHNTVARGLYRSLGYDNPNAWASRVLAPRHVPLTPRP